MGGLLMIRVVLALVALLMMPKMASADVIPPNTAIENAAPTISPNRVHEISGHAASFCPGLVKLSPNLQVASMRRFSTDHFYGRADYMLLLSYCQLYLQGAVDALSHPTEAKPL